MLKDKSCVLVNIYRTTHILTFCRKLDLSDALKNPALLTALTHAPSTQHPSLSASQAPLKHALEANVQLVQTVLQLEDRLNHLRASTQTQLLSTLSLERAWRAKQSDMDRVLSPFSPSSLYQRMAQGVQEQEQVCQALEESFLEGDGVGKSSEREVQEWVRGYREARKVFHERNEKKGRWEEGRVGGWR
jgi:hypothetical protein